MKIQNGNYLAHHGVKGQKWGVRRYQYEDGSLTPRGRKRNKIENSTGFKRTVSVLNMKVEDLSGNIKMKITGKQYVDSYLKKGTSFKRIQTSETFEKFAFYATYKKDDSNKYMGLFGKNLKSRANASAKEAEKLAAKTKKKKDVDAAKTARDYADNLKVYQLSINAVRKLKVPSDENAAHITNSLLKNKQFRNDVKLSIADSKEKMRRPSQQILFNKAQKAMQKDPSKMSSYDKIAVYKALNLSLTNHNSYEVSAQNRFYDELKKKGYNALLDYNDKEFSSYHAKRPMIVFDNDSVKLHSVTETNPKIVNKLYMKYSAKRVVEDAPKMVTDYVRNLGSRPVKDCTSYVNSKTEEYLKG